jgi:hypothetical protein
VSRSHSVEREHGIIVVVWKACFLMLNHTLKPPLLPHRSNALMRAYLLQMLEESIKVLLFALGCKEAQALVSSCTCTVVTKEVDMAVAGPFLLAV